MPTSGRPREAECAVRPVVALRRGRPGSRGYGTGHSWRRSRAPKGAATQAGQERPGFLGRREGDHPPSFRFRARLEAVRRTGAVAWRSFRGVSRAEPTPAKTGDRPGRRFFRGYLERLRVRKHARCRVWPDERPTRRQGGRCGGCRHSRKPARAGGAPPGRAGGKLERGDTAMAAGETVSSGSGHGRPRPRART